MLRKSCDELKPFILCQTETSLSLMLGKISGRLELDLFNLWTHSLAISLSLSTGSSGPREELPSPEEALGIRGLRNPIRTFSGLVSLGSNP